ncbi:hypothetical protein PGUG_05517 [Meyerozyma guilliermondii ATCC 6260]|uniref:Uncharacterized protein n=1 Tax=Meyerozyma guilliermondii (strain ATCC 6260 / CBS 566 / DSM 6381 / JCM 1539 / NBRC 10279 / NRRL Y-324) TaxID=294746 RepID=A5DQG6_PICGU|nr:uncharacterized protein PGUG_05517 [Meyerozyma guilliermondii ATCC 6260]EDK41418.2 hypothetical protein PGUG_05517 [Meyerozyma guilliermondii ATCC 6260]
MSSIRRSLEIEKSDFFTVRTEPASGGIVWKTIRFIHFIAHKSRLVRTTNVKIGVLLVLDIVVRLQRRERQPKITISVDFTNRSELLIVYLDGFVSVLVHSLSSDIISSSIDQLWTRNHNRGNQLRSVLNLKLWRSSVLASLGSFLDTRWSRKSFEFEGTVGVIIHSCERKVDGLDCEFCSSGQYTIISNIVLV